MYKSISKRKIKSYINSLEKKLKEIEEETQKCQMENENSKIMLYDLTEQYLLEERISGKIESAKYILNCL